MSPQFESAKEFLNKHKDAVQEYAKEIAELQKRQDALYEDFLQKHGVDPKQKPLVDYIWDALFNDFDISNSKSPN